MNGQCQYVHDGYDTDGTEWFRCITHDELAPSSEAPCAGYKEIPYSESPFVRRARAGTLPGKDLTNA